jgi:hypothetical protein
MASRENALPLGLARHPTEGRPELMMKRYVRLPSLWPITLNLISARLADSPIKRVNPSGALMFQNKRILLKIDRSLGTHGAFTAI